MTPEKLKKIIEQNCDAVDFAPFGNGVSDECLSNAEARLNTTFPPSYKWWLKKYRGGEIHGDEIFSIYETDYDDIAGGDVVYMNKQYRNDGFIKQNQLAIQSNDQAELYYLELSELNEFGEAPVYISPEGIKYADSFLEFIHKKILE